MDSDAPAARNRRFSKGASKWLVFTGDCRQAADALASKPATPLWVAVGFVDTLLRSYGQVVLCNNPLTGLLVAVALLVTDWAASLAGLAACSLAIVTAWLADQPAELVRAGLLSYNSLLMGLVTTPLVRHFFGLQHLAGVHWLLLLLAAVLGVYLSSAFGALLGHISQHPLPALVVPFLVVQWLVVLCAAAPPALALACSAADNCSLSCPRPAPAPAPAPAAAPDPDLDLDLEPDLGLAANASDALAPLDWQQAFSGALQGTAQVFAQQGLPGALLIHLAVVLSSPTSALMGLLGATVNTLAGALLSGSREALYSGEWAYNGWLSAAAVGGFALVLTPQSAALAVLAALLAAAMQAALTPALQRACLPLLSLPFNLATLLLLCATAAGSGSLVRPAAISSPEQERREWRRQRRERRAQVRSLSAGVQQAGAVPGPGKEAEAETGAGGGGEGERRRRAEPV